MNAEQFKLPPELHPNEHLPFSWKWKEERQDDYDTYPKNCYVCGKTSRGVPTVACDFCPLVYHLDCLDPPLCEIPTVSVNQIFVFNNSTFTMMILGPLDVPKPR